MEAVIRRKRTKTDLAANDGKVPETVQIEGTFSGRRSFLLGVLRRASNHHLRTAR